MVLLSKLKLKFHEIDVEWRIQRSGIKNGKPWAMVLAYITNRAIMDRLDEVCGPENWKNEFIGGPCGGVLCGISIKINDEWVTKWDGAENTQVESIKGGLSSSMKRSAVQWGIGRYLYNLDINWANIEPAGKYKAKIDDIWVNWNPPQLPAWALPENDDMYTETKKPLSPQEKIMTKEEKQKAFDGELF